MRIVRVLLVAVGVTSLLALGSCSRPPEIDGVLWRQIIQYKDAMWPALDDVRFAGADAVRAAIDGGAMLNGPHWDGVSDPEAFTLSEGGLVTWGYSESPFQVNVIIASGERDPESDPDGDYPYSGPSAWHTCATLTFYVVDEPPAPGASTSSPTVGLADVECPAELVATLQEDSQLQPIHAFDG